MPLAAAPEGASRDGVGAGPCSPSGFLALLEGAGEAAARKAARAVFSNVSWSNQSFNVNGFFSLDHQRKGFETTWTRIAFLSLEALGDSRELIWNPFEN